MSVLPFFILIFISNGIINCVTDQLLLQIHDLRLGRREGRGEGGERRKGGERRRRGEEKEGRGEGGGWR